MKKVISPLLIFVAVSALWGQQNVSAPQKFALVIGNSNYTGISPLTNPVNDANDMEAALRELGFTVEKVLNGNLDQMETAVLNLRRRLGAARNTYGFFYYAGHGVQSSGQNYLIPVAADNIRSETQLRDRAVSLQFVLDTMAEAGNELNMVVLDACRDNPFSWARSGSRGLSVVSAAPTGSIVMYATGANSTAADGTGRNGLFTGHLLNNLKTPGLSVFELFDRTMDNVISGTNGRQHPELSLRFPGAARAYLGSLPAPAQPAPVVQPSPAPAQPSPAPVTAQPTPATVQPAPTPAATTAAVPAMVRINGGTFTMGSPANEPGRDSGEGPRQVTVSSFYMSKYEVTQKEYQEVTGTNPSILKGDTLPVENVTWFDAIEYCNKRSQKEGLRPVYTIRDRTPATGYPITAARVTANWRNNGYRLPTEAEWEYACRAGTTTAYNTGSSISDNTGWYNENSGGKTQPVGQKPANAWGLHDMHGNISEWCWDWYGSYATRAQTDPRGAASGNYRVVRGGSWYNTAMHTRSAIRYHFSPGSRNYYVGFRVVRR